jgi:hypothetical protein
MWKRGKGGGTSQRDPDGVRKLHLSRGSFERKLCVFLYPTSLVLPGSFHIAGQPSKGASFVPKHSTNTLPDEIIDMLLDQEGFECDPISRIEGDTPLHSAVRYINSLTESQPSNPDITTFAQELISMMVDAGSDPRIRNKANLTPYQLTDPRNAALKQQLQDAIDIVQNQGDYIVEEEEGGEAGEEDDYAGSGSDSDFDPEEYRREKQRRDKEKKALANGVGSS